MVVSALFFMLALVGVFQLIFAVARLPRLVKYLPAPVLAGFQNAAAIAIMFSQLPLLLGATTVGSFSHLRSLLADVHLMPLVLGALTLVLVFNGHRLTRRVPPIMLGLAKLKGSGSISLVNPSIQGRFQAFMLGDARQ
jgi:SulP family sulfate permease